MRYTLYLLFIVLSQGLLAQSTITCSSDCTGNLGENIFPDGDFGSGIPNVVSVNPNIAPGYGYQTAPPPLDGFYVITNNTTNWGSFANPNWINIMDNGPEPNGYMMVVNAALAPGLFYDKTVTVCENTLYELSVDLISMIAPAVAATNIKSNVAFLIDGVVVCETGDIPHDATWKTYSFSFITDPGVTSVNLSLRNNAPGGLGNDLAIDNISFRACGPNFFIQDSSFYCPNEPLILNTNVFSTPYATPVYQWQTSVDGVNWSNIAGANTLTYSISGSEKNDYFRLLSANSLGNLDLLSCRSVSQVTRGALEDLSDFAISGTDTTVCNGKSAFLKAGIFAEYEWSNGTFGSQMEAQSPGLYSVTVTTENGCTATDDIMVEAVDLTAELITQTPVCFGENTGSALVQNQQGGFGPVEYALDMGVFSQNPSFENLGAGTYVLQLKDSVGCTADFPFMLESPIELEITLDTVPQVFVCEPYTLAHNTNAINATYLWESIADMSCDACPNPVITPLQDSWVSVQIMDAQNCQASDSIWVDVIPRLDFYAANVFMPESGDDNRFFDLFPNKSASLVTKFMIYDRWGTLIFSRENVRPFTADTRWDGSLPKGKEAPAGVYIWFAEIEFGGEQRQFFEGDVLLIR